MSKKNNKTLTFISGPASFRWELPAKATIHQIRNDPAIKRMVCDWPNEVLVALTDTGSWMQDSFCPVDGSLIRLEVIDRQKDFDELYKANPITKAEMEKWIELNKPKEV